MFCPNCGTQNEEAASTCSKCGFNLRASAPKFKGTMMMVNSPGAGGVVPVPGTPGIAPGPAAAPAPAHDQAAINKALRGTVVGIAPPAAGGQAPVPSPFGPPPGVAPAPAPAPYTPPEPAVAPAHVGAHAPVNPFAGTMIGTAPPPNFPGFPDPGAPAGGGSSGASGGGGVGNGAILTPPIGTTPAVGAWNAPAPAPAPEPAAWGGGISTPPATPTPFGADQGYGQPPGASQNALAPSPMAPSPMGMGMNPMDPGAGAMVPTGPSGMGAPAPLGGPLAAAPGGVRNPTQIALISVFGCGVGAYYGLHQCRLIEGELKKMLGRPDTEGNILWYIFPLLPILSMPALVAEARARVGTPTQGAPGLLGYLFGWFYTIPTDANEIYEAAARRG